MATTIGTEYDHIDITNGVGTIRHPLKDSTTRELAQNLIKVQDTQPESGDNVLWVKETPDNEVEVPTYEEFNELKSAFDSITDIVVTSKNEFDNIFDESGYISISGSDAGQDKASETFKRTSKFYPVENYQIVNDLIYQYFKKSEEVASGSVVYYDSNKQFVDSMSVGNTLKGFPTTIRYFRVYTYATYNGLFLISSEPITDNDSYDYTTANVIKESVLPDALNNILEQAENGKVLSDNNFTDADKAKVDSIINESTIFTGVIKNYFIGEGFTYSDPVSAWNQWVTDGKPKAVFYISKGTYNVMSNPASSSYTPFLFEDANVQIIGEDVDSTVIKSTTGKYIHSPIFIRSGNVTVKNITFIANHEDNPDFDYSQATTGLSGNAAYAMHIDGGSVGGAVVVENCRAWSWQSCGLGLGTIKNSSITITNCDVRSFTDPESAYADARVALSRGALVYHTFSADDTGEELFALINSFVYSKNGTCAISITKNTGNDPKDIVCKCNLIQGDAIANVNNFVVGLNLLTLSEDSYGNNVPAMNYST